VDTVDRLTEPRLGLEAKDGERSAAPNVSMGAPITAAGSTKAAADDEVTDAIIHASRTLFGIAVRSLTASEEDVTLPQYRALVTLAYGGGRRLADLASSLGVSPSTATRMCDRLVRKGLINRTRDEIDRREVNLEVTPSGHKSVESVIERRRADVHELLERLPQDIRNQLVESLNVLSNATGKAPEVHWSPGWHE
jgi:DNA-binding MarR family transcriptional regulator